MREKLAPFATFELTVAGVPFVVRRRTTELMLQLGEPSRVFGLLAGYARLLAATDTDPAARVQAEAEYLRAQETMLGMMRKAPGIILVEVAGEPVTPDNPVAWDEVAPFMDVVFEAFIGSGLNPDPTPDSCKGQQGSK